jgi:hypothetical protein
VNELDFCRSVSDMIECDLSEWPSSVLFQY